MSSMSTIAAATSSVLLAAMMAMTSVRKFRPDKASVELRDRLNVSPTLWTVVGVPEVCAALGLAIGLWWPPLGVAAAAGTALLMAGAFALHLRERFLGKALVPPIVVGGFAVLTAVLRAVTA